MSTKVRNQWIVSIFTDQGTESVEPVIIATTGRPAQHEDVADRLRLLFEPIVSLTGRELPGVFALAIYS